MLTYKRKLKLTTIQEDRISSWMGACRAVYNMGLEIKIATYKCNKSSISKFALMKQITDIRDISWINDVPRSSLDKSIEKLDLAYKNFFRTYKSGGGFPKFKSKRNYNSIVITNDNFKQKTQIITVNKNTIKLPKIGKINFFKDKSSIIGRIKTATIIKEPTGFFICITCDEVSKSISNTNENQVIGIDMGVANFYVDSNGNLIENPRHFKKYEVKLRIESRNLSRKKKFSTRWKKQAKKLALLHHKIANIRKDFLHKESTKLAKKYHTVYLEDLNIKNMSKNKNLSKNILDCGWGIFRTMLEYKTNVIRVDPKYTSQTCNECGVKDAKSRLSQSEFVCTSCGHISHADLNAAKNIMSKGIALNRKREPLGCALVEEPSIGMSVPYFNANLQQKH